MKIDDWNTDLKTLKITINKREFDMFTKDLDLVCVGKKMPEYKIVRCKQ